MRKTDFCFHNKECCPGTGRTEALSVNWIKKCFVFSSSTVLLCFFILKALSFINSNKVYSFFEFNRTVSAEQQSGRAHILPLLVNLKGEKGPQLFRAQVYITLSKNSLKNEFLSYDKEFEKHLLFILSGQEVKVLQKKRSYFEQQIRSQLNAFLSKDIVDGVRIQTKMLN